MTQSFNSTSKSVCLTNVLNPDVFMLSQRPQQIVTSTRWKPLYLQQQSRAGVAAQKQEFSPPPPLVTPSSLSVALLSMVPDGYHHFICIPAKSKRTRLSSPWAALYTSLLLSSHWPGFNGLCNECCSK